MYKQMIATQLVNPTFYKFSRIGITIEQICDSYKVYIQTYLVEY